MLWIRSPKNKMYLFIFSEWYESSATLMSEEGAVIGGLLVSLNVIDCNICIKGGDLDVQVGFTVDFCKDRASQIDL